MNTIKTFGLMAGLMLLLIWIGGMIGGQNGMIMAFAIAAVMNFVSYWFSDKIVLMLYRAKEIKEGDLPQLHNIVRALTLKAGIPMPRLYYIDTDMPNAFATGRDPHHAAVAVTRGILNILNEKELTGVIAHELSHVKNRDILISTVAATIAGAIFMLARMAQFAAMFGGSRGGSRENGNNAIGMLAIAIVAPIAALVIQMAISRSREYEADASGARLSGAPLALADALRKISAGVKHNPMTANPTMAHMFIVNPFSGKSLLSLFSTHPPMEERVKRLDAISEEMSSYKIPKIIY